MRERGAHTLLGLPVVEVEGFVGNPDAEHLVDNMTLLPPSHYHQPSERQCTP